MGDLVIENLEATAGQCRGAELKTRVFHRRSARTIADQDKKVLTFGKLEPHPSLRSAASSNLRHFLRKVSNPKVPNREMRWQKMVTVPNFFFQCLCWFSSIYGSRS